MKLLIVLIVAVSLGVDSAILPKKNGGKFPELFWFQNDNGQVLPALLHGKPTKSLKSKGISDDVQFYLYNSKTPAVNPVEILPGCAACLDTFVQGAPTVFLVHGFSSSHLGGFGDGLRENFAKAEETYNLVFVNWERLAAAPWYEYAAENTKPVGEWTGQMIEYLVSGGFAQLSEISFAGHSLGSHVANFVAHNITIGKIPVVHALDPALPLFGERDDSERIDPSDGDFVNVIHTAMGTLLDGGLAFTEPRGHADFYPNSGKDQPNCGDDAFGACSHSRAHQYFGESAYRKDAFYSCEVDSWEDYLAGVPCRSNSVMGLATPTSARGIFYLETNGDPPYGIGAGH